MRLIDADALIERLKKDNPQTSKLKWTQILAHIAPTIDAEPVKHGKWIEGELYIKCSECGYPVGHLSDNFCPNCGADMRGDTE